MTAYANQYYRLPTYNRVYFNEFIPLEKLRLKVKVWVLTVLPLTWVRLKLSRALQSWNWQL